MRVTVEDGGPCRKVMRVEVPAQSLASEYQTSVESFARVSRVPGFRRGRAPADVVERHYRKQIVDDAKERLVPRFYRAALEQEHLTPVATVGVTDVALGRDEGCSFKVALDVAPDFKLPKYRKLSVKAEPVEVSDAQVDEALQGLRTSAARYEDVSGRAVQAGDLVQVDYRGEADGRPVSELAPDFQGIGEGKGFWVPIGGPEFLPGLSDGLLGASAGEEREIRVRFPADYRVPAVAGREAVYRAAVKAVRQRVLPEMDEAFLKRCEVESADALRARVRADLTAAAEAREKDRQKAEIALQLLKQTEFDLPQTIVEQETRLAVNNIVRRILMNGMPREKVAEHQEEIVKAATATSRERVKLSYVLTRIAEAENIGVEDDEVSARIEAMARHYQITAERLRSEIEKQNGIEGLKSEIRQEKALDNLLEQARVK